MKLSHTFRSPVSQKVPKLIGLTPRGHENYETDQNWNSNLAINSQKHDQFTGYFTPGSNKNICPYENALTYSQANDRITEFQNVLFNAPTATQIKSARTQNMRKEHPIGGQKIKFSQQRQNNSRIKEQILQQVYRMIYQHKEQSAKSLRQAVFKIDESIKRQCITQFNRQFISLSFLDDIDRRFNQLQEQIKNQNRLMIDIQANVQKQKYSIMTRDDKVYRLNQEIQLIKNQIKSIKFSYQIELGHKLSNIPLIQHRCTNMEKLYNQISIKKCLLQQEVRKISIKIENDKKQEQIFIKIKKLQDIIQQIRNLGKKQKKLGSIKKQQSQKDRVSLRGSLENDKLFQILQMSQNQLKSGLSLSLSLQSLDANPNGNKDLNTNSSSRFVKKLNSSVHSLKHIKSTKYILDNSNQLMDQCGNYILDQEGKQIKLSDDQIQILKESNIVKYQQP